MDARAAQPRSATGTAGPTADSSTGPAAAIARDLFLADRDIPCPSCRHNLRNTTADTCPRCGADLILRLVGARDPWVPPLFAALVFGWLLLAGAMNMTREGFGVYGVIARSRIVQWHVTFPDGAEWLGGPMLPPYNAAGRQMDDGRNVIRKLIHYDWSAVSAQSWLFLSWSVLLAAGGLSGFALLWRHYRRGLSGRAWARARLWTGLVFAAYAGVHLYYFALEQR